MKKLYLLISTLLLTFIPISVLAGWKDYPNDFVTTWKTDVAWATEPTKVTINFQKVSGTAYYEVSWKCDGNYDVIWDAK